MTDRPRDNSGQRDFWDDAAKLWTRWQPAMDRLLAPALEAVLLNADPQPGERGLDIGCGAGTSTARLAGRVASAEGEAVGVDISAPLLRDAQRQYGDLSGLRYIEADAQNYGFPPQHFDCVISRLGVMFFADNVRAFANIAAGIRPGGRFVMAAWGPPQQNPYFTEAARAAKSVLGDVPPSDRTLPGPFAWEDPARILPQLAAAGLTHLDARPFETDLPFDGNAEEASKLLMQIGAASSVMRQHDADEAQRRDVQRALADVFSQFEQAGRLSIPAQFLIYTARNPA